MIKKILVWICMMIVLLVSIFAVDINTIDKYDVFKSLDVNLDSGEAEFKFNNPLSKSIPVSELKFNYVENCGHVKSIDIFEKATCVQYERVESYDLKTVCDNPKNGSKQQCWEQKENVSIFNVPYNYPCEKELVEITPGDHVLKIKADIEFEKCSNGNMGYEIDWIPNIKLDDKDFSRPEWAWWNTSYNYCRNITVVGGNQTLNNYTVPIHFDNTSRMLDNGSDLVFINAGCDENGTRMNHEIEYFVNNDGSVWVLFDELLSGSNGISVYYNISTGQAPTNPTYEAWHPGYVVIYHLSNIGPDNITFDSMQERNGVNIGTDNTEDQNGRDTRAIYVNESQTHVLEFGTHHDSIYIGDKDPFSFTDDAGTDFPFTAESWINVTSSNQDFIFGKDRIGATDDVEWSMYHQNNGAVSGFVWKQDTTAYLSRRTANSYINFNEWYHAVFRYDGSQTIDGLDILINGIEADTVDNIAGTYAGMTNTQAPVRIGARGLNNNDTESEYDGEINEVRLFNDTLSNAWINYTYNVFSDQPSFITIGPELEPPVVNTPPVFVDTCSNVNIFHNENLFCLVNATDADNDSITFSVNDSRVIINSTTGALSDNPVLTDYNLPSGWNVTVTINDGQDSASFIFNYKINDSPPVINDQCNDVTLNHNFNLSCQINASDPELDTIFYHVNDSRVSVSGSGLIFDDPTFNDYNLPGCWDVTYFVNDSILYNSDSFKYCINSTAPVISAVFNQASYFEDETISLNFTVSDPELDNVNINITWYVNDTEVQNEFYSNVSSGFLNVSNLSNTLYSQGATVNLTIVSDDFIEFSEFKSIKIIKLTPVTLEQSFEYFVCPETLPNVLILFFIGMLLFGFCVLALIANTPYIGFFAGLGFLFLSLTIMACFLVWGYIVLFIGLFIMIFFAVVKTS